MAVIRLSKFGCTDIIEIGLYDDYRTHYRSLTVRRLSKFDCTESIEIGLYGDYRTDIIEV